MDKELTYLILIGTITFIVFLVFIVAMVFRYYKRNNQYHQSITLLEYQKKQELFKSQLEIQEQIFSHVSRELHDNLGQVSSLIKINLNTLRLDDPAAAAEKIENTKELTRQMITDIKQLSASLGNERIAESGLAKMIEIEVERLAKTGEFTVAYDLNGPFPDLENDKALMLYRMIQEILNNIVKHSGARHISILLNSQPDLFILVLADDGMGFSMDEKRSSGGAGLRNLQNRARLIDAKIDFDSLPGKGTKVTIAIPI